MSVKQLWISCYSEKEDVSITFGTTIDSTELSIKNIDTDFIAEGISDAYWENCDDFKCGIEKAKSLQEEKSITYREALYMVFGDFSLAYEVDNKEIDLLTDMDINDIIYSLFEE